MNDCSETTTLDDAELRLSAPLFYSPETVQKFKEFKRDTRKKAPLILGLSPFTEAPPLNLRILSEYKSSGINYYKVQYGNLQDDLVYAWLLVPVNITQPGPAVICLPGSYMTPNWGKDAVAGMVKTLSSGDPEYYGLEMAKNGFITLCPDYPCAGERVPEGLKPYDTTVLNKRFPEWSRTGLSVFDISRAVDVLFTRPEVDVERIGCIGWSQGGEMTVWGTAMDERIRVAVSVCGWAPWHRRRAKPLMAPYNYPRMRNFVEKKVALPIGMDQIAAMIAPRPFLNISAIHEQYYDNFQELKHAETEIAKLYRLFGKPEAFATYSPDETHRYSIGNGYKTLKWLNKHL